MFLLNVAQRRLQRWMAARAQASGVTAAQSGLLFILGQRDGVLMGEAGAAGRAAMAQSKAGLTEVNARLTEGFTEAEINVVARWLTTMQTRFPRGEDE